ncbi:hypothetical protein VCRA2110O319_30253 [Vibrio crassostreae]|nr:hypothetical protein VCRA2117O328_10095 [Vibrio crassostreae]CAK2489044.1 hypothetical protein VCRA2110O319_30253 [Vibrio crassostreae]
MTVTYQVLNMANGGGSENLLINPRGKINQLNESDGVLSVGQYFCDGWKAGAAGAEVYRDADGFRLISGSILQQVPNNLDIGRTIKGNMDTVLGTPAIRINGGTDSELSDDQPYITFEVFGNNSKFSRLILAESESLPIYQQSADELSPCLAFLQIVDAIYHHAGAGSSEHWQRHVLSPLMAINPAVHRINDGSVSSATAGTRTSSPLKGGFLLYKGVSYGDPAVDVLGGKYLVDGRL